MLCGEENFGRRLWSRSQCNGRNGVALGLFYAPIQSSSEQFLGSPKLLSQLKFCEQQKCGAALEQFRLLNPPKQHIKV